MDLFVIGEIVKTKGLRGCLKAYSFLENQEILDGLDFVYLESKTGRKIRHDIQKMNAAGRFLFLELSGVTDVDKAQAFVGFRLLAPRGLLKELPEGEYYWQDIIGLPVFSQDGRCIGQIESIFQTKSNDVYVCRGDEGEFLIPAIEDAIAKIDLQERKITLKAMEGLLS